MKVKNAIPDYPGKPENWFSVAFADEIKTDSDRNDDGSVPADGRIHMAIRSSQAGRVCYRLTRDQARSLANDLLIELAEG